MFVKKTFPNGGHVRPHKEETMHSAIADMPLPQEVVIPLVGFGGKFCDPAVAEGDMVITGQVIGRGLLFPAICHASVAGEVTGVTSCYDAAGDLVPAVRIKVAGVDQRFAPSPSLVPTAMSPDELLELLVRAGVEEDELSGKPLYARISAARDERITTLIINGMESEPYVTADARSLRERSALLIYGARGFLRLTGAARCVLAVPATDNMATDMFQGLLKDETAFEVYPLRPKYPQGDSNQLVKSILGNEVPRGSMPSAAAALILQPGTVIAYGEALVSGRPMLDRVISVSGSAVRQPGNLRVPLGTPVSYVLEQCKVTVEEGTTVIWGGPMRGVALSNLDVPVDKTCAGITALAAGDPSLTARRFSDCVNCAACVEQCPQMLYPNRLSIAAEAGRLDTVARLHVLGCTECGLCSYICPAGRPITQMIRASKKALAGREAGEAR